MKVMALESGFLSHNPTCGKIFEQSSRANPDLKQMWLLSMTVILINRHLYNIKPSTYQIHSIGLASNTITLNLI